MPPPRLAGKRLYIADLARRQAALELGLAPMNARAYRLLSKRLQQALAGQPAPRMRRGFPELPAILQPTLDEALDQRHFDDHGTLPGAGSAAAMATTQALLARLMAKRKPGRTRKAASRRSAP